MSDKETKIVVAADGSGYYILWEDELVPEGYVVVPDARELTMLLTIKEMDRMRSAILGIPTEETSSEVEAAQMLWQVLKSKSLKKPANSALDTIEVPDKLGKRSRYYISRGSNLYVHYYPYLTGAEKERADKYLAHKKNVATRQKIYECVKLAVEESGSNVFTNIQVLRHIMRAVNEGRMAIGNYSVEGLWWAQMASLTKYRVVLPCVAEDYHGIQKTEPVRAAQVR